MRLGKEVKKEDFLLSDPMNKKRADERYLAAGGWERRQWTSFCRTQGYERR
jgi:hypothetical protein